MKSRFLSTQPAKVIIADDHPLFREAIKKALEVSCNNAGFLEAGSFEGLQDLVDENQDVDLVLLDLHMPGVSGFAGLVYLCKRYPGVPVVMISANEDPVVIRRALDHGAAGFIPKSSSTDEICEAINTILAGEIWSPDSVQSNLPGRNDSEISLAKRMAELTPQQFKVLMLMTQGLLNKQIAYELKVSEPTIKAHVTAIMKKLAVNNRTQAVLIAQHLSVARPN
ncbi:MAG: response regulator transcription factor [Xanthomonadales bacterium]|nr:response regulator transcription factor [Xanthomonadales bacterium]